jgi:Apoptosis regulator proteins, Bcl-2 family
MMMMMIILYVYMSNAYDFYVSKRLTCWFWYFPKQVFNEMCQQLHITPNNAQATFFTIINELFSDGIRWGRVVALFSFSGALSVQCVEKEMPVLVDQVVDWTVAYIEGHLMSWILQNGNWVSVTNCTQYLIYFSNVCIMNVNFK